MTLVEDNDRDSGVVEEICGYLTSEVPQSFFLFAGAGSGKTRTLVEVLRRLTGKEADHDAGRALAERLRVFGQGIRVVTYTVNAVNVINGRLGMNDLADVSTIHSFCWDLIAGYTDDLREALLALNSEQLKEAKRVACGRARGPTQNDQRDIAKYEQRAKTLGATTKFVYYPDRNKFGDGALFHAHVLAATAWLLKRKPTLRAILASRYPIVLIDESQDTMKGVLGALMEAAGDPVSRIALGLLGDHRQRIYPEGQANLPGSIPETWRRPSLQMNHRSQYRIVELINRIWQAELEGRTEPTTGVQQHSRSERNGGVVRLFIGDAELSTVEKTRREELCSQIMADASGSDAWKKSSRAYQVLALEHKLAAQRGRFENVFGAMDTIDSDAARPQWHGNNVGPAVTRVLLEEIPALVACVDDVGAVDEFAAMEVLTKYERLSVLPPVEGESADSWLKKYRDAVHALGKASISSDAKVRDILAPVVQGDLFHVDPLLREVFASDRMGDAQVHDGDDGEESGADKVRRGLTRLLDARWSEVRLYKRYLEGRALQATHQVVKGSEFEHVMVIMDDKEAGGFLFSYDKLFGAKLSKTDVENAKAGKETAVDRTLRLLYVTCSRARETLALVLWASNPKAAIEAARKSDWFSRGEVLSVPEG